MEETRMMKTFDWQNSECAREYSRHLQYEFKTSLYYLRLCKGLSIDVKFTKFYLYNKNEID